MGEEKNQFRPGIIKILFPIQTLTQIMSLNILNIVQWFHQNKMREFMKL